MQNCCQISGALLTARVVNESGAGMLAGFFFVDINGTRITEEYVTDNNGYFHVTVPDFNSDKIFVNIYSTEEYEPVVKTFTELTNDGTVVLIKKTKDKINWPIVLGASTILLSMGKRKVGAISEGNKTLLIVGGLGFAVWQIFKYKPSPEQKAYLEQAASRLKQLADDGIVPSLPLAQFTSLALAIRNAVYDCGTNEPVIYNSFETLNNEADLYQLILSFGIQKYKGCFEGEDFFSGNIHNTLSEAIISDLTSSEIGTVNAILSSKSINFKF